MVIEGRRSNGVHLDKLYQRVRSSEPFPVMLKASGATSGSSQQSPTRSRMVSRKIKQHTNASTKSPANCNNIINML